MITLKPKRRFSALLAQRERKAHELAVALVPHARAELEMLQRYRRDPVIRAKRR
jgi:hypothetical protein